MAEGTSCSSASLPSLGLASSFGAVGGTNDMQTSFWLFGAFIGRLKSEVSKVKVQNVECEISQHNDKTLVTLKMYFFTFLWNLSPYQINILSKIKRVNFHSFKELNAGQHNFEW